MKLSPGVVPVMGIVDDIENVNDLLFGPRSEAVPCDYTEEELELMFRVLGPSNASVMYANRLRPGPMRGAFVEAVA